MLAALVLTCAPAFGQLPPGTVLVPPPTGAPVSQPNKHIYKPRPNAPPVGEWDVHAAEQTTDGKMRHLRGHAEMENVNMLFRADEMDYNEDTGEVQARGNVYFEQFERNEKIWCDHVDYNTKTEAGKFYDVRGTTSPRIDTRPGMLTSLNPYYFQGKWAERLNGHYILYDGFLTNCRVPNPWWRLKGPRFNVVPQESAKAYRSVFLLRKFPLFYTPFFYKSLEKVPRRTGLLMPNIGHSSTRGVMLGVGAFWAINRSYDATYHVQDYTARGYAHHLELRGKPTDKADFDAILFGVQDRGIPDSGTPPIKQGGYTFSVAGKADLGDGWTARGFVNYLSSYTFRQAFSDSFNEAVFSEVSSVAFLEKDWSSYTFDTVVERKQDFTTLEIDETDPTTGKQNKDINSVIIKKLPELDLSSRDHQVADLPVWYSFDSSAGLLSRSQPDFYCPNLEPGQQGTVTTCPSPNNLSPVLLGHYGTNLLDSRMDFAPQITSVLHLGDFHLVPSFTVDETFYGETQGPYEDGFLRVLPQDYVRSAREFKLDLLAPSFARVFDHKSWLGDKLKHVIEPKATYEYVTGIGQDFNKIIHFDETDLLSNTNQVTFSLANRVYAKRGDEVVEIFSWQLSEARYFDPTFGGVIQPGTQLRNVLLSQLELTPFAFLDGPRNYSPVVSELRVQPKWNIGFEWRTDYDPVRHSIVASTASADWRKGLYFVSVGQTEVHSDTTLLPNENQMRASFGIGNSTRRGWNAAAVAVYDDKAGVLQYAIVQATYNSDCCGFSVQLVRLNFGTRDETQYRFAFAVANLGSFGTLKRQERLF
ncbi:MAG TPA: LPS assembly protein LptD [Bryobacteraceae bacterium]|nr:LPS assembly protein LptD [Bryobacteraceae bacterium]